VSEKEDVAISLIHLDCRNSADTERSLSATLKGIALAPFGRIKGECLNCLFARPFPRLMIDYENIAPGASGLEPKRAFRADAPTPLSTVSEHDLLAPPRPLDEAVIDMDLLSIRRSAFIVGTGAAVLTVSQILYLAVDWAVTGWTLGSSAPARAEHLKCRCLCNGAQYKSRQALLAPVGAGDVSQSVRNRHRAGD
jgi:hypothetical protein